MSTRTLAPPQSAGPIHVELGTSIVQGIANVFQAYPRQYVPLDRNLLSQNGYGDAAIRGLESGSWITYHDRQLTAPGNGVIEFPDGIRYETSLDFLGGETIRVTIVKRLPDAVR